MAFYTAGSAPQSRSQVYFPDGNASNTSISLHQCTTFEMFRAIVCSQDDPIQLDELRNRKPHVTEYFAQAVTRAAGVPHASTEAALTRACLHPLVNFQHIVMEDTSGRVCNYHNIEAMAYQTDLQASRFRSMAFVRGITDTTDRVDIVGRIPVRDEIGPRNGFIWGQWVYFVRKNGSFHHAVPNDDDPPEHGTVPPTALPAAAFYNTVNAAALPYPVAGQNPVRISLLLPASRTLPWNIAWVIELKRVSLTLIDEARKYVHQVAHYLESLIRITPKRQIAFGVLTNLRSCVFVAVREVTAPGEPKVYQAFHSREITADVANQLATFVSASPGALGLNRVPRTVHFTPTDFVGRGSTGAVIGGNWRVALNTYVPVCLKVSVHRVALFVERSIIAFLLNSNVDALILPSIHQAAQNVLYEDFFHHCTVFRHRYTRQDITRDRLLQIWTTLCTLHEAGVTHGDIRTPNMMYHGETDRMILIDYSAARIMPSFFNNEVVRAGVNDTCGMPLEQFADMFERQRFDTASDAVLLGDDATPADEACSIIYAAIKHNFKLGVYSHLKLQPEIEKRRVFVRDRRRYLFSGQYKLPEISDLQARVENNLAALGEQRQTIDQAQRTALVTAALDALYRIIELTPARLSREHD